MDPLDYVVRETERQSGTMREALGMYKAWEYGMRDNLWHRPSETHMKGMCGLIKGNPNYSEDYRVGPAVFSQGSPAIHATRIPRTMNNLFGYIKGLSVTDAVSEADELTKEFLEIHPFADGNGRVGSLLWNWLRGSLEDPEPMPYFFGEA